MLKSSRDSNSLKGANYDSNHVYGARTNYIRKPTSSFDVLTSKPKSSQLINASSRRQVSSGTSFLSQSNGHLGSRSSRYAAPSPPKQSLTFTSSEDVTDITRPTMRDHSIKSTRPHVVAGDSQKTSTVLDKYHTATTYVPRPPSRDRSSSLGASYDSRDSNHTSKSSPILTRALPSLPSRHSPVIHRTSHTKEEISIDDPPYSTGYLPSFLRSTSPKRVPEKIQPVKVTSLPDGNGTIGLKNIGNTCFMNSMLQCLSHTLQLRDYCLRSDYEKEINASSPMRGKLMKAFAEIIKELWSGRSYAVTPSNFKTQIQRFSPRFVGYEQQDSQEFLRFLLEGLHEDINQVRKKISEPLKDLSRMRPQDIARETWKWYEKKDKSFVFDLFVGQLESHLQCGTCGHISLTYDPFWDLSLPISKSYSSEATPLDECLRTFTKEEILDRDEKPMCERCKVRRKMVKRLSIHRFPSILVIRQPTLRSLIALKNFRPEIMYKAACIFFFNAASNDGTIRVDLKRFHEGSRYRQKLSNLVSFPVDNSLKLAQFASSTCEDKASSTYDLYAVSNHCGSCYGGHYTAFCYNFDLERWHEFNDSRVSNINQRSVCTKEAYVLFYVQRSSSQGRASRL